MHPTHNKLYDIHFSYFDPGLISREVNNTTQYGGTTMKALIIALVALAGTAAQADGFVCENAEQGIRVKVYDRTQAGQGTRNAAIMILSDMTVSNGHKTTATFNADDSLVTNKGATYTADVDLRFGSSDLKGRNIGGTKLGMLDTITLDVDYSFNAPVASGTELSGQLILAKRNGDSINLDVSCVRYLKGQ